MKRSPRKLRLSKETLHNLENSDLMTVGGGAVTMDRSVCVTICATNCNVTACATACPACA